MTTMNRMYCTVAEVWSDLYPNQTPPSDEARVYRFIESASTFIDRRLGQFIPVTATRYLDGNGERALLIDPPYLLAATTIINEDTTLTTADYILTPSGRMWDNGPYTSLVVDPDATLLGHWHRERGGVTVTGRWGLYEQSGPTGDHVENTTSISATETALTTASNILLSVGMVLLIEAEQALVTAHPTTNTWTLVRGINGTTAAIHLHDVAISKYAPPADINFLCRELTALGMQRAATGFTGQSGNAEAGDLSYISQYPKATIEEVARNYRVVRL